MTLKIERSAPGGFTVLSLSGRNETEHAAKLKKPFELETDCRSILVDLEEIKLVDREAVRFPPRCEADGMTLENRPAYIREWMEKRI